VTVPNPYAVLYPVDAGAGAGVPPRSLHPILRAHPSPAKSTRVSGSSTATAKGTLYVRGHKHVPSSRASMH
jgi:hypothetical protein